MALGAAAIALASATGAEHRRWREAAEREAARYGIDPAYTRAALAGESAGAPSRRSRLDWTLVCVATAIIVGFGLLARVPELALEWRWVAVLAAAMLIMLWAVGLLLWRTTRFN